MRLIKASSIDSSFGLEIVDVHPNAIPPYAILSHTWTDQEVLYTDVVANTAKQNAAYDKLEYTCRQAIADGYEYCWADTCCIDKRSSAELSEAINSMYEWYQRAGICYGYLPDCSGDVDATDRESDFFKSRWFTRGWTLQELLAPPDLIFFGKGWVKIGEKTALTKSLAEFTGIDEEFLTGASPLASASVAKRMSWASLRETSRPEDIAYCLMGLFGVNMPMLYGEGDRAFLRLQEEIMNQSDDHSLFAWADEDASQDAHHGLLAKSPSQFYYSNSILPYQDWEPRSPYSMSNRGLRIDLHLTRWEDDVFVAALDCPVPPAYESENFLAIYLQKISDGDEQYARIKVGKLAKIHQRGNLRSVYIRQDAGARQHRPDGILPNHVLQLRNGPDASIYSVEEVVKSQDSTPGEFEALTSSRGSARSWLPQRWPLTYRINKEADQLALGIILMRSDGERLLLMLGSTTGLRLAFDAIELPVSLNTDGLSEEKTPSFEEMRSSFMPTAAGEYIELVYHRVRVDAQPKVHKSAKYYFIDIQIETIGESSRVLEAMKHAYQLAIPDRTVELESREKRETKESREKKRGWRRLLTS
ncbi:hypothetical protein FZEAL_937 [Fusarium zealandicum]|uniref:Heterokaryon incompatibility domain-containing protein n=1 Tax=Fusarium zealandicum TaxID=1053134 RepID=A0A8H4UTR1_9HYPO|nr:hypothetical protein FZEAL_937 [Fusarium zealandicum]